MINPKRKPASPWLSFPVFLLMVLGTFGLCSALMDLGGKYYMAIRDFTPAWRWLAWHAPFAIAMAGVFTWLNTKK